MKILPGTILGIADGPNGEDSWMVLGIKPDKGNFLSVVSW